MPSTELTFCRGIVYTPAKKLIISGYLTSLASPFGLYHYPQVADLRDRCPQSRKLCTEVLPGLRVVTTPGHTAGHQSVVVSTGPETAEALIGDAAYTSVSTRTRRTPCCPPGQAADLPSWHESITRLHGLAPCAGALLPRHRARARLS